MTSAAIVTPSAGALNLNVAESQINELETESLVERLENSGKVVAGSVAEGGEQKQEAETQPQENQNANGQLEDSKSVDVSVPVVDGAAVDADKTEPVLQSGQPLTDLEKKQRRAERFGVGLNMSEGEKRKIRASRFGGDDKKGTTSPKADSSAAAEAERRNARAARFGISNATATATADDEETKKKARLNRFTGVDSNLEAEKKKARAARFGSENEEGVKKKLRTDTAVTAAQG